MISSMMFPGHFMGLNLMTNGQHPSSTCPSRQVGGSTSSVTVSAPSPSSALFPPRPPPPSILDPSMPPGAPPPTGPTFWPPHLPFPNFFGIPAPPPPPAKNSLGMGTQVDLSAFWLNKGMAAPFMRPPMPPYIPAPQPQPQVTLAAPTFVPACIPKSSDLVMPPMKKRFCNPDRIPTSSPYSSTPNTIASTGSTGVMASGECCPICREKLPTTSTSQELKRHFVDDAKKTEEQFLQLKRKLTADCIGASASANVSGLSSSPDPAVKSRLDTYQRVRENRLTRMREKMATMQLSHSNGSAMNRKLFGGTDFMNRQPKEDKSSGRQSVQRSVASGSSRSSSTTPRSAAPFRSPITDQEAAKTPTPASSTAASPSAGKITKTMQICKLCHGPMETMKVSQQCRHILCGQCWDRAVGEAVENPVCPICAIPVTRQDIQQASI